MITPRYVRYPSVAQLARRQAWIARRGYLDLRSSYSVACFAEDIAGALAASGEDVRWLRRYTKGVRLELLGRNPYTGPPWRRFGWRPLSLRFSR